MCLPYETALENVFRTITDMTIMSSAYFFYLKKCCKKLGKKPLSKDRGEGKRGLWRLLQVKCRHFKRKEFDLFSLFQARNLGRCFELKCGSLLWWPAGSWLFKMENHQDNVGRRRRSDAKCLEEMEL